MRKVSFGSLVLFYLVSVPGAAQELLFPAEAVTDPALLSRTMPVLARELIAAHRGEDGRVPYLDNLFRLQLVAEQYIEAIETITALRAIDSIKASAQAGADLTRYELFALAKVREAQAYVPFETAFAAVFREAFQRFDDRTAALVAARFIPLSQPGTLQSALAQQGSKRTISLADALKLMRVYQLEAASRAFVPLIAVLITEDDERRYFIDRNVSVKTPDGAVVCALIVRPRATSGRLTALLNFTIYANPSKIMQEARRTASHGYAGVEGLTRGKACSPGPTIPMEHDGSDAATLIDWISRQPWSDGRVGTFGGSYEGFTQWSAAKRMPSEVFSYFSDSRRVDGLRA